MSMTIVSRPRPTSRKQLPDYLSAEEVDGLLSVVDDGQARTLFLLEWRVGLRVSEALNLQVQDVNLRGDRPSLRIECGKGGKSREVPIHPDLAAVLHIYVGMIKEGPLFSGLSRPTAHRRMRDAFAKAKVLKLIGPKRGCSNHTLRHSPARHWLASGGPINVVSRWLGDASLANTLVYLQIVSDSSNLMDTVS